MEVHERRARARAAGRRLDLLPLRARTRRSCGSAPGIRVDLRLVRRISARRRRPISPAVLEGRDLRAAGGVRRRSRPTWTRRRCGRAPPTASSTARTTTPPASPGCWRWPRRSAGRRRGPARSLLFLVPSGEEKGLWGSAYYVDASDGAARATSWPTSTWISIGRNWADSVIVSRAGDVHAWARRCAGSSAAHPELRMAPLADRWPEERIFYRSDHYNFAVKGVPVLFFTSGTHPDYHQPTDAADRIDAEKASRLVRLVFHRRRRGRPTRPSGPGGIPGSHRRLVERSDDVPHSLARRRCVARRRPARRAGRRSRRVRPPMRPRPSPRPTSRSRVGIIAARLHARPRHAEPGPRAHRPVRGRPVPSFRSPAGRRERRLVPALPHHPPAARAGELARRAPRSEGPRPPRRSTARLVTSRATSRGSRSAARRCWWAARSHRKRSPG